MITPPTPQTMSQERNVVAIARREELAQQADDDARDDHPEDVHRRPFHLLGTALFRHCASTRPGRRLNPAWGIIALPACRAAHTRAQVGASPPRRPRPPQGSFGDRASTSSDRCGGQPPEPTRLAFHEYLPFQDCPEEAFTAGRTERTSSRATRERGEGRVAMTQDELLYRFRLRRPCPPLVRRS